VAQKYIGKSTKEENTEKKEEIAYQLDIVNRMVCILLHPEMYIRTAGDDPHYQMVQSFGQG